MRARFFHPYPKYLQLRDLLRSRIGKELRIGESLPPEPVLAAQFRVSRETLRAALGGLEGEGLIVRRRRTGTVIAALPDRSAAPRMTGLVEHDTALGSDTGSAVRAQRLAIPGWDVASELGVDPEAAVLRVERMRALNGEPFAFHEAFVPFPLARRLQGRDLGKIAIVHELQRLGEPLVEEWQRIEATVADTGLAGPLRVPLGAPLLAVTRLLRTRQGRLAVLFRTHFRADRYYYTVAPAAAAARKGRPKPAAGRRPKTGRRGDNARKNRR